MSNLTRRIKNVGPGALVAAAFIGPGTVASCSISGASAGYTLLWAMLLSVISVIIMQSMAARLSIVSGMGLGEALRTKFTGAGARILICILVIAAVFVGNIAYETGNLTGSILGIQAAIPAAEGQTTKIILALVLGVIAFILLFSGSYRRVENILTALVVVMGIIFLICAFASKPAWGEVFNGNKNGTERYQKNGKPHSLAVVHQEREKGHSDHGGSEAERTLHTGTGKDDQHNNENRRKIHTIHYIHTVSEQQAMRRLLFSV